MSKLSAVVLLKNEDQNIEGCLNSLDFCQEVIIVHDYLSKEGVNKIRVSNNKVLQKNNIKIIENKLNSDFAAQRNFGLKKATGDWIIFIDADEIVSPELRAEIEELLKSDVDENAFYLRRRDYFWGKEIKHGEVATVRNQGLIRLVRKASGQWEGKVHERFVLDKGNADLLDNFINHYPHQSVAEFIRNINNYSSLRAEELFKQGKKTNIGEIIFYPLAKFILTYFLQLGFLDGAVGFVYSFFMSFHSFLVRIKLYQKYFEVTV